jgi:hypothetical protein
MGEPHGTHQDVSYYLLGNHVCKPTSDFTPVRCVAIPYRQRPVGHFYIFTRHLDESVFEPSLELLKVLILVNVVIIRRFSDPFDSRFSRRFITTQMTCAQMHLSDAFDFMFWPRACSSYQSIDRGDGLP